MATRGNMSRRRRYRAPSGVSTGTFTRLFVMLAVAAAVIFSIAIFFKVNHVEVQGNSVYDAQTVMDASGLEPGDNLLAVNKAAVAGKIRAALPYVEQIRVARRLPDTIVLYVSESAAEFIVKAKDGTNWLMSTSGKILEQISNPGAAEHPSVEGLVLTEPKIGSQAVSETPENLSAALTLLAGLDGTGLLDKISRVDAAKPYDLVLWYTDQYEIRLGGTDQIEYKVQYLMAVLEQLTQYRTGTIDLTFKEEKVARFIPW